MRPLVIAAIVVLLAGCSAPPTWTPVEVDATAASIIATDSGVLMAGHHGDAPWAATFDTPAGTPAALSLHPNEPYAAQASLVALASDGERRWALGTATGGAHGNARWSVWTGSSGELISHPQTFFTFGGHDAGPLLGIAVLDHQPVIVGVRTTSTGARAALYQATGDTWSQLPAEPTLSSTSTSELSITGLTHSGDQLVLFGDDLHLDASLTQQPLIWVGRPGSWLRLPLPVPDQLTGAGVQTASAAACADRQCWVAGWAHGHPLVWQVDLNTTPTVVATSVLDGTSAAVTPTATVTITQGHPVVAVNTTVPGVMLGCGSSWRSLGSPGAVQALAATEGGVYAVTDGRVRFLATPHC